MASATTWCGPVLTWNGEVSETEIAGLDHPRAPDIALVLKRMT